MNNLQILQIKSYLMLKGITGRAIARHLHVTPTWVSLVLRGRKRSDRVRKAIAEAVGKSVAELWPGEDNDQAA